MNPLLYEYLLLSKPVDTDHICGVMVLASGAVDRGLESRSGQTNDYGIGTCYFSVKSVALKRKSKDLLAMNQDNVYECSDIATRGQLFQ